MADHIYDQPWAYLNPNLGADVGFGGQSGGGGGGGGGFGTAAGVASTAANFNPGGLAVGAGFKVLEGLFNAFGGRGRRKELKRERGKARSDVGGDRDALQKMMESGVLNPALLDALYGQVLNFEAQQEGDIIDSTIGLDSGAAAGNLFFRGRGRRARSRVGFEADNARLTSQRNASIRSALLGESSGRYRQLYSQYDR